MKNILAENMIRFGVKNLTESDIQRLNEANTAAFERQDLLAIQPDQLNPAVKILNDTVKRVVADVNSKTGGNFKALPISLQRKQVEGNSPRTDSIYSLNVGDAPIKSNENYKGQTQALADFYNSDPNDESKSQGIYDGQHFLSGQFARNKKYVDKYLGIVLKTLTGTNPNFRGLFYMPTFSGMLGTTYDEIYNSDAGPEILKPASKALQAGRLQAMELINKTITSRFKEFESLNKQLIARTGAGGMTSQGTE